MLKDDMENYIYYTTMGGKAKIKIDVVPHKFDCQPNRKRQGTTTILRPAAAKRRRQQIIQEILIESSENMEGKKTGCTLSEESKTNKNLPQPDAASASLVRRTQTLNPESEEEMQTDIHPSTLIDAARANPVRRTQAPAPGRESEGEMQSRIHPSSLLCNEGGGTASHSDDDFNDEKGTGDDKKSVLKCDTCQLLMKAFRYTCVQCPDFTMCDECEAKGAHPDHYVLRVPGPRPWAEVKAILDQIRSMSFPDIDEEKVYIDSIKMEIKEEPDEIDPLRIPPPECDEQSTSTFDDGTVVEHSEQPCNTAAEVPQMEDNMQEKIVNLNENTLLDTKEVTSTNSTVNIKQLQQATQMTDNVVLGANRVPLGIGANTVLANIPPEEMIPRKNIVYIGQLQQASQKMERIRDSVVLRVSKVTSGPGASTALANIAPKVMIPNLVYIGKSQQASQMTSVRDCALFSANGVTSGTVPSTVLANIASEEMIPQNLVYIGQSQQASIRESAVFRASGVSSGIGANIVLANIATEEMIPRNLVYIGQLQQPNQMTSVTDSVVRRASRITNWTVANSVLTDIAPEEMIPRKNLVYIGQLQQASQMTSVRNNAVLRTSRVTGGTGTNTMLVNIAPKK